MSVERGMAYCFVCGESGDCLKVAKTILNSTIAQAVKQIDEDFRLGLGKPLTAQEKRKYAEQQKAREVAKQRQANLEKFERECLDKIAEKLRTADDFIREKAFKGVVGSDEMHQYSDSLDHKLFIKAVERKRWLEWLWCVITGDTHYLVEEDFCAVYGTEKVEILRKVYKKKIEI